MKFKDKLAMAGRELKSGNFGNAITALRLSPDSYPDGGSNGGGFWLFNTDQGDMHFTYSGTASAKNAYIKCPPLNAVINRKAQAYINGKSWILSTQGATAGKEATNGLATKLRTLLAKPNPIQSWKQFEAQLYIYTQLFGYCIVMAIKPVGFSNQEATKLWIVPPFMLEIEQKPNVNILTAQSWKDFIKSVSIDWGGYMTPLDLDTIFLFKDITPSFSSYTIPESRTQVLEQAISNIIGTLESRGVLINKRGPSYVISSNNSDESGNVALTTVEKADIQEEFKKYGLRRSQVQAIITSANINLQTMGFATKDLLLFEEMEDCTQQICDEYNYPYRLLASSKSNSLGGSDIKAFKTLLYQDAIIPEAESFSDQWNAFFELEGAGIRIEKDYSHVSALQEDQVAQATARFNRNRAALIEFRNNVITLNQWRDLNGDDPIEGDLGGLYYYQLLEKKVVFGNAPENTGMVNNGSDGNNSSTNDN